MRNYIADSISEVTDEIVKDLEKERAIDNLDIFNQPDRDVIKEIIIKLNRIVFPGYYIDRNYKRYNISTTISSLTEDVTYNLQSRFLLL